MCEPQIVARTGLSVREHQERTVANYLTLRSIAPDLPFIPVLQGWRIADYLLRTIGGLPQAELGSYAAAWSISFATGLDDPEFAAHLSVESGGPDCGRVCLGAGQHCSVKNRVAEIGATEIRSAEVGPAQVSSLQVCPTEVCAVEVRVLEDCLAKVGICEISAIKLRAGQSSAGEIGVAKLGTGQPGIAERDAAQVYPRHVDHLIISGSGTAAQDPHRCLNIGGTDTHPGQLLIHRRRRVLRSVGSTNAPLKFVANISSKEELDRVAVGGGVLGDAFECVDAADTDIDVLTTELVHGPGETFGDLAFSADVHLPPSRCGANDYQKPDAALKYRRSRIVGQSKLGLLQLDARLRVTDAMQICSAEWGIEEARYQDDPGHDDYEETRRCQSCDPDCAPIHVGCSLRDSLNPPPNPDVRMPGGRHFRWFLATPWNGQSSGFSSRPGTSRSEFQRGPAGPPSADLFHLLSGSGQADLQSFDLAEPAAGGCFFDPLVQVGDDLGEPYSLFGVGAEHGAAQASLTEPAAEFGHVARLPGGSAASLPA